jgi:hypothetical protein
MIMAGRSGFSRECIAHKCAPTEFQHRFIFPSPCSLDIERAFVISPSHHLSPPEMDMAKSGHRMTQQSQRLHSTGFTAVGKPFSSTTRTF